MSIVALKRKTQAKYNNMSVGSKTGFSLNGTHRSQGYIGQTMLSRSLPRTLMKGNVAKGHGGCCGKYPQHGIIQSAVTSENDNSVIKSSSLTTFGMLRTHYKWIWRPQPFTSTKIDSFHNTNPQSNYIAKISTNTAKKVDESNIIKTECQKQCTNLPREALPKHNISLHTRNPGNIVKTNITRPENTNALLGISSSNSINKSSTQQQYINKLNAECTGGSGINIEVTTNCMNKQSVNVQLNKTPLIGGTKTR